MAETGEFADSASPSFPIGRVKKIVKLDAEISKVTSESLFLISRSAELFLHLLASNSAAVASSKKRKIITLDHIRVAVKRHRPTSDFLLDELPMTTTTTTTKPRSPSKAGKEKEKRTPGGARRIDSFFKRSESGGGNEVGECDGGDEERGGDDVVEDGGAVDCGENEVLDVSIIKTVSGAVDGDLEDGDPGIRVSNEC